MIKELAEQLSHGNNLTINQMNNMMDEILTGTQNDEDVAEFLKNLTEKGNKIAHSIRQKHDILLEFFEILGVGNETANQDAEGVEHHLNPKTIRQLRKFITFLKSNPKITNEFNEF